MNAKTVKEFEAWRQEFIRDNTKFPSSQDAWNAALEWARTQQEPVAAVVYKYGDPEAFGERELVVLTDLSNAPYGTKLYAAPVAPTVQKGWKLVPEAPTPEMVEAAARAIWNIRREYEDRCDMELEDIGNSHSVWAEGNSAVNALLAAAPEYKEGE